MPESTDTQCVLLMQPAPKYRGVNTRWLMRQTHNSGGHSLVLEAVQTAHRLGSQTWVSLFCVVIFMLFIDYHNSRRNRLIKNVRKGRNSLRPPALMSQPGSHIVLTACWQDFASTQLTHPVSLPQAQILNSKKETRQSNTLAGMRVESNSKSIYCCAFLFP